MGIHQIHIAQRSESSFPTAFPCQEKKKPTKPKKPPVWTLEHSLKKGHKANSVPPHHRKYINSEQNAKQNQDIMCTLRALSGAREHMGKQIQHISAAAPAAPRDASPVHPASAPFCTPTRYESNNCPFGGGGGGRQHA